MLIDELESFSDYLRATKSKATRFTYMCRVRAYLATLTSDEEFTTLNVRAYKDRLGETLRPRAVASHIASLRAFGKWLVEVGHLGTNPIAGVKTPKLDAPERDTPTDDEIAELFDALPRIYRPQRRALAGAVLSVLVYAGVRRAELLALKLDDIDLKRSLLHVRHGKGDKPRAVPLVAECRDALAAYLKLRPAIAWQAAASPPLFLRRANVALADDGLRELLNELFVAAGRNPADCRALLPHGLRHAFATRMYEGCKDLVKVGGYLGHSDPSVTADYIHTQVASLREIVQYATLRRSTPTPPAHPEPDPGAPARSVPPLRLVEGR